MAQFLTEDFNKIWCPDELNPQRAERIVAAYKDRQRHTLDKMHMNPAAPHGIYAYPDSDESYKVSGRYPDGSYRIYRFPNDDAPPGGPLFHGTYDVADRDPGRAYGLEPVTIDRIVHPADMAGPVAVHIIAVYRAAQLSRPWPAKPPTWFITDLNGKPTQRVSGEYPNGQYLIEQGRGWTGDKRDAIVWAHPRHEATRKARKFPNINQMKAVAQ